ncbi:hypothetical protein FNT36_17600 [Hymenobacter setariae]|uniref:Outer membrane protein beta-barrel domain-containing protein n=1 Tax=Hymenobacter setariae TaxID=2594794 RepID=A0A558BSJ5_9BACT|nr:hypothetical protein [Hymenobacter setariae]TVT39463.1 hypothetical protein FNT36_17600 [Hymenobacter setariae]
MTHTLPIWLQPQRACWLALGGGLLVASAAGAQAPGAAGSPPALPRQAPRLSLVIDNRNSFVQASAVRIIGLNIGVVPRGKRYRLGLGAYTLRRSYADLYTYLGRGKNRKLKDTLTPALNLTYFTPNFSYTFLSRRFIELSVPVDVGLGRSHYTITDENGKVTTDNRGLFVPAEVGLGVLLKPTRWVGISAAAGYRVSLKEIDYKEDFNGWYYSYRLNLFVGNIWHDWKAYRQRVRARRDGAVAPPAAPTPGTNP